MLITRGFKDTFRLAGGARSRTTTTTPRYRPPDVVERDCIEEITERVTSDGEVVVALDEDEVRAAVRRLRDRGVEAIAICFLWSFKRPGHEQRAREIVAEEFPERVRHALLGGPPGDPRVRAVHDRGLQLPLAPRDDALHRRLQSAARRGGFAGTLTFFQGIGGSVGADAVACHPITLLAIRPGRRRHGRAITSPSSSGWRTSSSATWAARASTPRCCPTSSRRSPSGSTFGPFHTGINILDVVSVGAGGGSIAWIDARGVPQVGPHSAGSEPGPACYGRGGTQPTVTDANVVARAHRPRELPQGPHALDAEAAGGRSRRRIGEPLGWSVEHAAAAIYDLAVIEMANALRVVSIERGHDPRDFTFFSYGGGLPLFAVEICRRLGCPRIVIPDNSSAFSAYGVLIADYVRQYERTVGWDLGDPGSADRSTRSPAR